MDLDYLTTEQIECATSSQKRIFLEGDAGCGKTSAGVARLFHLISSGVPANQILVLTPQRTLATPYHNFVNSKQFPSGSIPSIITMGGLARRMINLFWPLIAGPCGFKKLAPPTHLTMETAQYYLSLILSQKIEQGYFETIRIERNRLFGQILDNLNKAAIVGFPHDLFGEKLSQAWIGKSEQLRIYEQSQECANLFREFCLLNNLLDYSLQVEVFSKHIWPSFLFRNYIKKEFTHLVFDNVEEDVPIVHDMIKTWLPELQTAFLIFDTSGGFRSFLGADPISGYSLKEQCEQYYIFDHSHTQSTNMNAFRSSISSVITHQDHISLPNPENPCFSIHMHAYFTDMINWTAEKIGELVLKHNVPPGEICVLSPFLSDSLRFAIYNRLAQMDIPVYSRRPSRSLREEKANICLLTIACLSHPQWGHIPKKHDFRSMLMQSISGIDLVRADLLTRICYHPGKTAFLTSFEEIQSEIQERITYSFGERFDRLRTWLLEYQNNEPLELDVFLSKLYGEILSQTGYGYHSNYDATAAAARLIESIQKFRFVTSDLLLKQDISVGKEYLRLVEEGLLAAKYIENWESPPEDAVFLSPAYTFIMSNQSVDYQFWLDIGSIGWWERLNQPLTHPYVLSRNWTENRKWTHGDEEKTSQANMDRLVGGLIRRCKKHSFLCATGMNEQGKEERGPLIIAVQKILREMREIPS